MFTNKFFAPLAMIALLFIIIFTSNFIQSNNITENEVKPSSAQNIETSQKEDQPIQTAIIDTNKTAHLLKINEGACTGCHGTDWNRVALEKSRNVAQMTHNEIADALVGYKNGTYGGAMKNLMKAQVEKYPDEEIKRFASTIGKNEVVLTQEHNESNKTNAALKMNEGACTGCHGSDWGKIALEKSRNVSKMTHNEITEALMGYKNGTYGGAMKNLMKAQVEKYSDDEIRRFSNTIGR